MSRPVLYEDEHLVAVQKPSGINTHKPDRYAPDGLHEWLTTRDPRWAKLSILHRLDKDTSGVIVFGKTRLANQSLTKSFKSHQVVKTYLMLSATRPTRMKFWAKSPGQATEFEYVQPHGDWFLVRARPSTGKTHQIRRHAADNGFAVLGDTEYGGAPASRLMLHAHVIEFVHPQTGKSITIEASVPEAFEDGDGVVAAREFREMVFEGNTNAFRLISGAADGYPDVIVESFDGHLLVQWQTEAVAKTSTDLLERLQRLCLPKTVTEQLVTKQKRTQPVASARFKVCEYGLNYLVAFGEGLSPGIFLDQRENRRRLARMKLTGKTVLNCFAYTCAFSVAAAQAGGTVTSVDLSRNYLEWGKDNFRANNLNPDTHDFIYGDVFEWLVKFAKARRTWDVVLLDPPTFSTSKKGRTFRAERDYRDLAGRAMAVVAPGGTLFCSTNLRTLAPADFEAMIREAAQASGRVIAALDFVGQPFDFRVGAGERPYLKTLWATLE